MVEILFAGFPSWSTTCSHSANDGDSSRARAPFVGRKFEARTLATERPSEVFKEQGSANYRMWLEKDIAKLRCVVALTQVGQCVFANGELHWKRSTCTRMKAETGKQEKHKGKN